MSHTGEREREWKYESKEKIVDDGRLSAGGGGGRPALSLFPNYQHLAGQQRLKQTEGRTLTLTNSHITV